MLLDDLQISDVLCQAEARLKHQNQTKHNELPEINSSLRHKNISLVKKHDKSKKNMHGVPVIEEAFDILRKVETQKSRNIEPLKDKSTATGPGWFDLPRTVMSPELRRDFQLLRMRNVLNSQRHYKKDDVKPIVPKFCHIGTIVEGPAEFLSARVRKKERAKSLAAEIMKAEKASGRLALKYGDIQLSKTNGKRSYYKAKQAKRR